MLFYPAALLAPHSAAFGLPFRLKRAMQMTFYPAAPFVAALCAVSLVSGKSIFSETSFI